MTLACLRPDLPSATTFTVSELPHRVKLDQNEAPCDLPPELKQEIAGEIAASAWNRYPQPAAYHEAKAKLAAVIGQPPEAVALTVGCDQVIQAAFLLAAGPGRSARWFEPTYPYYSHVARVTGTAPQAVILGADMEEMIDAAAVLAPPRADLLVLVAPGNPTGGMPGRPALDAALAEPRQLVLVDEAYADFAGTSVMSDVARHPNLLVGRSLSKSLLASARLGFAVGHPEVISALERVYTAPYHLNMLQLAVARHYAPISSHLRSVVADVTRGRQQLLEALVALPGVVPRPSQANFVLFELVGAGPAGATELHHALARAGVRVRNVSGLPGLRAHLRVSVGTRTENELFLAELRRLLS